MYPHERSLVKRLADNPFVLLGVNADFDREEAKQTIKKEKITWRSWWDEGGVSGPIQTQWQVAQRPTIYLIDAKGIIRAKDPDKDELDQGIDQLLKP